MPQDSEESGTVRIPCCGKECTGTGLDLLCPTHITCFEDRSKRVWPSVQHFALARRFVEVSLEEQLRMAPTALTLVERYSQHKKSLAIEWVDHRVRHLRNGFTFLMSSDSKARQALLETEGSNLVYLEQDAVLSDIGSNMVGYVLMEIRDSLLKEGTGDKCGTVLHSHGSKPKRRRRRKHSPFYHKDGTATFDMVSSSAVRVTIEAENIVIPMSAIPPRAKTAAHVYQFKKKRGFDDSDADSDYDDYCDDEVDSDAEEYLIRPNRPVRVEELALEPLYPLQSSALRDMGFTDDSSVLAALMSSRGDLESAAEILTNSS